VPISFYFADFCFHRAKLILEVDGDFHFEEAAIEHDSRRDEMLRREGYRVLRVTNRDVMRNMDGVLTVILSALGQPPPSIPPHKGEGGQHSG
jgi:very-short-patch-repair endonuclease